MKKYKYALIFIGFVFSTFMYSCFCTLLHGDSVWSYGFSYNISQGLIIYRDFNVMVTPLFFFIGSLFIKIFGSYILVIHFMCAISIGIIMSILFKLIKYKAFIIYPVILYFYIPSYNFMCLMLLFIIIYLINLNKDNDILIGFIISFMFLTKQSVGILLIPGFIYAKDKKKFLISFSIPILLLSIYLIYNNCLYQFIDYCFLGLFDFSGGNKVISLFFVIEVIVVIGLGYQVIKSRFKDKEVIYILLFQIISYPIFDLYHFIIVFFPVVYYIIKYINNRYVNIISCFTLYFVLLSIFINRPYISREKNYLYFVNDHYGKYSSLLKNEEKIIKRYNDYKYKFYIMGNAYLRKLYVGERINHYDFMLDGNIGYHGDIRIINEINDMCKKDSCVFFVERLEFDKYQQFSKYIYDYVIDTYSKIDSNEYFDIYVNEKE